MLKGLFNWKHMNWKRFWMAMIGVFILSMILEWGSHNWLINLHMSAISQLWHAGKMPSFNVWMWLGYLVFSWAFVWVYASGWENKAWFGQGFRFGIMIWMLWAVPIAFMYFNGAEFVWSAFFQKLWTELVIMLALAFFAAWLYRPMTQRHA